MRSAHIFRTTMAVVLAAGSLVACDIETFEDASSGFGNNPPAPPPPPPPPPPGTFGANFSEIQTAVFTPSCATANCHSGAGASAGLNLDAVNSYTELVGIASSQDGNIQRVAVGDPNNSYLIQKLEGTAATGAQMPSGAAPLPQTEIDVIRQWISDGAIDDRVVASTPIRVMSIAPMPGAALTLAPTQIIAGFDRALDVTTVNANTFILQASGGDGSFAEGNEVAITAASISVPGGNPQSAVFDLTGVALLDDTYRVSLLGSGASIIMDLDGNALDGEFVAAFPSGNGTEGGDFRSTFAISTPIVIGPTLDQIQAVVFTPSCAGAGCHSGPSGGVLPAGLDLSSADASFMSLVGVPSIQNAAILRVAAADPDNSYLIMKMEGNAGGIMPPAGMLDPAVIAEIRQWIADGALR